MVRKIIKILICVIVCCACLSSTTYAIDYTVYDGSFSNTYVTYFRDILSNVSIFENYVCFRSGQYEYKMLVGDLQYQDNQFLIPDVATVYTFNTVSGFSSSHTFKVSEIKSSRVLNENNYIIYSNMGDYPELESRGDRFETLQTVIIVTACMCVVLRSIFYYRKRR